MAHAKPKYAPPTMPTFCNDWLTSRSVAALPVAGEALFMRLLLAEWQSGPLPDDIEQIMTFTGYRKEFPEVWPQVRALFASTPDGLINERLEEIRSQWDSVSKTRSEAGKIGRAKQLLGKESGKTQANDTASDPANGGLSVSVSVSTSDTDSENPPTPQWGGRVVEQVLEDWNQMAAKAGLPKCLGSEKVRKLIARRAKSVEWRNAFGAALLSIPKSEFHTGKNDRGWRANLEWLLRDGKAEEVATMAPSKPIPARSGAPVGPGIEDRSKWTEQDWLDRMGIGGRNAR